MAPDRLPKQTKKPAPFSSFSFERGHTVVCNTMLYRTLYRVCVGLVLLWFVAAVVDLCRFPRLGTDSPESGFAGIDVFLYRIPRWLVVYAPLLPATMGIISVRPREGVRVAMGHFIVMAFCAIGSVVGVGIQATEITRQAGREARAAAARERGFTVIEEDGQPWGIHLSMPKSSRRLEMLKEYPHVQALYAPGTRLSDSDLEDLRYVNELEVLNLDGTDVTGAGLKYLKECGRLRQVSLDGCRIKDGALAQVGNLRELEELSLKRTDVSDEGLNALRHLDKLKLLHLEHTNVTPSGAARLKQHLPTVKVFGVD